MWYLKKAKQTSMQKMKLPSFVAAEELHRSEVVISQVVEQQLIAKGLIEKSIKVLSVDPLFLHV